MQSSKTTILEFLLLVGIIYYVSFILMLILCTHSHHVLISHTLIIITIIHTRTRTHLPLPLLDITRPILRHHGKVGLPRPLLLGIHLAEIIIPH